MYILRIKKKIKKDFCVLKNASILKNTLNCCNFVVNKFNNILNSGFNNILSNNIFSFKKLLSLTISYSLIYSQIAFSFILTQSIISVVSTHSAYADAIATAPQNIEHNPINYIEVDNSIGINNGDTNGNGNNAYLDRAQNGTPLVNINNATQGGVSANYYKDFNVTDENLILNNYKGESVNTNLGGVIYGNPNFNGSNGRAADIILNEITTNRVSNIEGYIEVAGRKADVIIANPNGIMVSGGGFINTSRLSLITGKSGACSDGTTNCGTLDSNGNLNPFLLTNTGVNPNAIITVVGKNVYDANGNAIAYNLGIDATNVNYVDLVSRIVKINGNIIGNTDITKGYTTEVSFKTGNDKAYYNRDANGNSNTNGFNVVSKTTVDTESTKPEFAIDSTAFGGVQAGRINFIATENGVGVRSRSDLIASVNDINFDVNGEILLEESGSVYAKNNVNLSNTVNTINNPNKETDNSSSDYGNIPNNRHITNKSYIVAENNVNVDTNNLINNNNQNSLIYSQNNITINSDNLDNSNTLDTTTSTNLYTGIVSGNDLYLNISNTLNNNYGNISSVNNTIIRKDTNNNNTNLINNEQGQISSGNNLTIKSNNINNSNNGYLFANGNIDLINLNNNSGTIESNGNITISNTDTTSTGLNTLDNTDGIILSTSSTSLIRVTSSNSVINSNGNISSNGDITINVLADYIINGTIYSNADVNITALNITNNSDVIAGNNITFNSTGNITNGSSLNITASIIAINNLIFNIFRDTTDGTTSTLYANTGNLYNYAKISTGNNLTINAENSVYNGMTSGSSAKISSNGNLTIIASDYIINKGSVISNSDLTLTTTKANTTNPISSTLSSSVNLQTYVNDLLTISETNSTGIYNYGRIATADELNLNSNSTLINYDEALIFSNNSMNLNIKDYFINYAGSLGTGLWSRNNMTIYNSKSSSNIGTLANLGGTIESYTGDININANELINSRISIPTQLPGVNYFTDKADGAWIHSWYSYNISGTVTRESQILSGNNLTINSTSLYNNASTMQAMNDLSITTNTLSNTAYFLFTGRREYWLGKYGWITPCGSNGWECWGGGGKWTHQSQKYYYDTIYDLKSSIRSGGTNTIVATNTIGNGTIIDGQSNLSNNGLLEFDTALQEKQSDYIESIVSSGTLDPLANIDLPTGDYGIFAKSDDPNSDYIYETDPTLIDVSKFLGSKYFLNRLGIDPDTMAHKFLGDAYFDNELIKKMLQDQALQNMYDKASLQGEFEKTVQERIDAMYNSVDKALQTSLGLVVGETLTAEQLNNLTEDIIWYVTQAVDLGNGEIYEALVPQIFLSKAHRTLLQQMNDDGELKGIGTGSMIAGNDVIINTVTDLNNTGNSIIVARNNLSIIADNDINNLNGALIKNLNNAYTTTDETTGETTTQNTTFQLLAGNDINNIGSQIQANTSGTAIVYAENNINNESTKTKVNQPGGYKEVISNEAGISNTGTGGSLLIQANTGDITNTGANISSDGTVQLVAGNDIVFDTLELESYSKISSKKLTVETRDITNLASTVTSENGSVVMQAGNNIAMTGTNIDAKSDIDLTANNNVIIENAVDSHYSYVQNIKKTALKKITTTNVDYVETAVESNLNANNINITAGNIILVQGSNLNAVRDTTTGTGGDTNLDAGSDVYITDAVLQEYHYATREVSNRGVYKGITAITSSVMSIMEFISSTALAAASTVLSNIDDPIQKLLDPIAPDFISDNIDYDKLRNKHKDIMYENSLHNTKVRDTNTNTLTNIVSSNINTDNDLTIGSTNSVTVQASNLNSDGAITINSQIFNVLADSSYNLATSETRTKRVMTIRNNTTGNIVTDITDSNIVSGSNNYNFNITDKANITSEQNTGQQTYITALKDQVNSDNINQTDIQATSTHWEDTTRQMTDVGLATAAIAVVVAVVLTAGTATAGVGAAAGTAAGSAATAAGATAATAAAVASVTSTVVATAAMATLSTVAATLATSTAQASMNADGDFFKQAKDISKDTWDSTTSKDAFESYAIAALSGALTGGATAYINNTYNGVIAAGNAANATATQQLTTALWESAISSTTSVAVQSALAGESFSEALKSQAINLIASTVGNLGAKQIGSNYHTGNFGDGATAKATQLTLHAILGATTATIAGNDALSGAVSGVIGEVAGSELRDAGINKQTGSQLAGLAGAFSAIFTGNMVGLDDSDIASNMYSGQRIATNAALYNAYYHITRDLAGNNPIKSVGNHSFDLFVPDSPEDFTVEGFIERGLDYVPPVDLGNGQEGWITGGYLANGNLVAEFNEATDLYALQDYYSNGNNSTGIPWDFDVEIKEITSISGISDTDLGYNLISNTQNYISNTSNNAVTYSLIPELNDGYNCNSFSNTLLKISGQSAYNVNDFYGVDLGRNQTIPVESFSSNNQTNWVNNQFYSDVENGKLPSVFNN